MAKRVFSGLSGSVILMLACVGWGEVSSPVGYRHVTHEEPKESVHVVTIDLTDQRVHPEVARGGADPDGDGEWLTTLLPTSEIASREKWDVAVNGDFFAAQNTKDVEGKQTGFVKGKWARPEGPAVTEGKEWSVNAKANTTLEFLKDGTARIVSVGKGEKVGEEVVCAVGGSGMVVREGKVVELKSGFAVARHPRTAVGLDREGKRLILVVVDGRQPGLSVGMTLGELGSELVAAGAWSALNLDGGGSTTLVIRDGGGLRILNSPSDGKERSVADALGFRIEGGVTVSREGKP